MSATLLLADDQIDVLKALRLLFKGEGFETCEVRSPAAVLEALRSRDYDLILMDLNYSRDTTSGREGLDLLGQIQQIPDAPPVVVMSGWGTIELAVEAMRRGAKDFTEKPWVNERLVSIVRTQVDLSRAIRRAGTLEAELPQTTPTTTRRAVLPIFKRTPRESSSRSSPAEHSAFQLHLPNPM